MQRQEFQPEITNAFGTPIITFDLPQAGRINEELRAVILPRRDADPGLVRSNVNGWHSSEDFLEWGGASARLLASTFGDIRGAKSSSCSMSA